MNKKVLITGASSGIGMAAARLFHGKNHDIAVLCAHNEEGLFALADELCGTSRVLPLICDVSDPASVDRMWETLVREDMLPDILINNAGIDYIGLLQDMSVADWDKVIATNLSSMFYVSRRCIPHMVSNHAGSIVNISSMWGNVGASCEVCYSASKGGVNAFTKALAKELAPSNIAVNAIAFGVVDTRMNGFLDEEERRNLLSEIPAQRMCSPAEAADIIYSVAMMDCYVTGQIITADGGMT